MVHENDKSVVFWGCFNKADLRFPLKHLKVFNHFMPNFYIQTFLHQGIFRSGTLISIAILYVFKNMIDFSKKLLPTAFICSFKKDYNHNFFDFLSFQFVSDKQKTTRTFFIHFELDRKFNYNFLCNIFQALCDNTYNITISMTKTEFRQKSIFKNIWKILCLSQKYKKFKKSCSAGLIPLFGPK